MGTSFLVIVDTHSKWPEVFEITTTSTAKTIAKLRQVFASHGLPEQLVSDNGPQFTSANFNQFMKGNHIRRVPYHPYSNGLVERFHSNRLLKLVPMTDDLSHTDSMIFLSLYSPCDDQSHTSLLIPKQGITYKILHAAAEREESKQADQIVNHNQHSKLRSFQKGQQVMVRDFHSDTPMWIPGTILTKTGTLSYVVQVSSGLKWNRHVDHLREYNATTPITTEPTNNTESEDVDLVPLPETDQNNADTPTNTPSDPLLNQSRRYPNRKLIQPDRYM